MFGRQTVSALISHSPQEISAMYGRLSKEQQQEVFDYIKNISARPPAQHNLARYFGVLKLSSDALQIQQAMRDEWR